MPLYPRDTIGVQFAFRQSVAAAYIDNHSTGETLNIKKRVSHYKRQPLWMQRRVTQPVKRAFKNVHPDSFHFLNRSEYMSKVICSETRPIRNTKTEVMNNSALMLVKRPCVK